MIQKENRLPAEYQEVEYLESGSNLNQRIELPYKCNQNSCIDVDFMFTDLSSRSGYQFVFECRSELNSKKCNLLKSTNDRFRYDFSDVGITNSNCTVNINLLYKLKTNKNVFNVYYNDNLVDTKAFSNYSNFVSDNNINFFSNKVGDFHPSNHLRIYKCKITENDVLKINAYPCYRKSDGVRGFYDLVSNTFCPNAGTSTEDFIVGPDINVVIKAKHIYKGNYALPEEYEEVEYLESTGTQYINIGIVPNDDYTVNVEFLYNISSNDGIYGVTNGTVGFYLGSAGGQLYLNGGSYYFAPFVAKTKYTLVYNKNTAIVNNIKYDVHNKTYINSDFWLFGRKNTNSATDSRLLHGKIYSFKMITSSDNVYISLIPCYRKSDNKPGMYDIVTGKFFTNQGTEEFITGPELKRKVKFIIKDNRVIFADESLLPSEYRRVKYLENIDTSHIDTKYMSNSNTSVFIIAKLNNLNTGTNGPIIGNRDNSTNGVSLWASLTAGQMFFQFGANTQPVAGVIGNYDIHKYYFDKNGLKYDNRLVSTNVGNNFAKTATLKLFATNPGGANVNGFDARRFVGNIYKCIILENGVVKLYLIPSVRNSDNKPGMYDLVTNTFFTNQGEGEFEWEEL